MADKTKLFLTVGACSLLVVSGQPWRNRARGAYQEYEGGYSEYQGYNVDSTLNYGSESQYNVPDTSYTPPSFYSQYSSSGADSSYYVGNGGYAYPDGYQSFQSQSRPAVANMDSGYINSLSNRPSYGQAPTLSPQHGSPDREFARWPPLPTTAPPATTAPTYTQPAYPSTNYVQGYYEMPEKPYEPSYTQSQPSYTQPQQTQAESIYTQPYGTQSQYTQPQVTISSIKPQALGPSNQPNVNEPSHVEEALGSDTQVQRQPAQPAQQYAQQSQSSGIQLEQAAQTQAAPETIPAPIRQPAPSTYPSFRPAQPVRPAQSRVAPTTPSMTPETDSEIENEVGDDDDETESYEMDTLGMDAEWMERLREADRAGLIPIKPAGGFSSTSTTPSPRTSPGPTYQSPTTPRPTTNSTTPRPSTTSTTPRPSTTSTTPRPSTTSTTPRPSTTSTTPRPTTTSTTPRPTTTSTTPRPSTTSTTPRPTTTSTTPRPSTTSTTPRPTTASTTPRPSTTTTFSTYTPTAPVTPEDDSDEAFMERLRAADRAGLIPIRPFQNEIADVDVPQPHSEGVETELMWIDDALDEEASHSSPSSLSGQPAVNEDNIAAAPSRPIVGSERDQRDSAGYGGYQTTDGQSESFEVSVGEPGPTGVQQQQGAGRPTGLIPNDALEGNDIDGRFDYGHDDERVSLVIGDGRLKPPSSYPVFTKRASESMPDDIWVYCYAFNSNDVRERCAEIGTNITAAGLYIPMTNEMGSEHDESWYESIKFLREQTPELKVMGIAYDVPKWDVIEKIFDKWAPMFDGVMLEWFAFESCIDRVEAPPAEVLAKLTAKVADGKIRYLFRDQDAELCDTNTHDYINMKDNPKSFNVPDFLLPVFSCMGKSTGECYKAFTHPGYLEMHCDTLKQRYMFNPNSDTGGRLINLFNDTCGGVPPHDLYGVV